MNPEETESLNITARVMSQLGFSLFAHGDDRDKTALGIIFEGFSPKLHAFILTASMGYFRHFCGKEISNVETTGDVSEHLHRMIAICCIQDDDRRRDETVEFVVEMGNEGRSFTQAESYLFSVGGAVHAQTCGHSDDGWNPEYN